ncbi:MAG: hypothetical protein Q9227_004207 [Pyrenula ochraceoflavens]
MGRKRNFEDFKTDDQGWMVVGKSGKGKRGADGEKTKYPELKHDGKVQSPIRLEELQTLALYVLADGVGPKWVAFKHAMHTRKVVMLMVPGLEMNMFHSQGSENEEENAEEIRNEDFLHWKQGRSIRNLYRGNPEALLRSALHPSFQPITDAFSEVWPIKAPGDSSLSRIHSPVQAILVSPLPSSKESGNGRQQGPVSQRNEKSHVPVRTRLPEFLHSLEELREAEYPIHPAMCQSAHDAEMEEARRTVAGYTSANGWVESNISSMDDTIVPEDRIEQGSITAGYTVYALDCEMVLTDDDVSSLARVSVIDWAGDKVLDELVKPTRPIKNYFTQFSGVTKELLDPITTTLSEIQSRLLDLLTPTTILLGHSLESDLTALKLSHPLIVDTSLIYPHPRGPPLRSSLKFLTFKNLKREIQSGGALGHDSCEDALAVLDLVKLKCEKGPKWGTSESSGEPVFRRIARAKNKGGSSRTTAIVDHGTPERGYGKEATYHLSGTSDAEIAKGVIRAVNGDPDGNYVRGSGVDFTWARFRDLESFRGWSNNNREHAAPDALHSNFASHPAPEEVAAKAADTISNIVRIHENLPPCTLFMVFSGTGDPRELGRLQALQRTYKREFRVKKWDDLTVKWTDVEEQALKNATAKAREGIGFLTVK